MFRKHIVQIRSNDLDSDDSIQVASIVASDASDANPTDDSSGVMNVDVYAPGERRVALQGPVTIYGYSMQVFGAFFGCVYQTLSPWDDHYLTPDSNDVTHVPFPSVVTAASDEQSSSSDTYRVLDAIKNVKFIRGYRFDPTKSVGNIVGDLVNLDTTTYHKYFPRDVKLGSAKMDKKFNRIKLAHTGKGLYRKKKISGMKLMPNSPTSLMTWNIKNLQMSDESGDYDKDGFYWIRLTIWLSYDAV